MSDEPEAGIFTTPADEQAFEPLPLAVHDGSMVIFDQVEFCAVYNCLAVKFLDGFLSVLDRDTGVWRDIGNPSLKKVQ